MRNPLCPASQADDHDFASISSPVAAAGSALFATAAALLTTATALFATAATTAAVTAAYSKTGGASTNPSGAATACGLQAINDSAFTDYQSAGGFAAFSSDAAATCTPIQTWGVYFDDVN